MPCTFPPDRAKKLVDIYQYKQFCSSISPASSTFKFYERDYRDIEQYDEEFTDDDTETAKLNFDNQDPEFLETTP